MIVNMEQLENCIPVSVTLRFGSLHRHHRTVSSSSSSLCVLAPNVAFSYFSLPHLKKNRRRRRPITITSHTYTTTRHFAALFLAFIFRFCELSWMAQHIVSRRERARDTRIPWKKWTVDDCHIPKIEEIQSYTNYPTRTKSVSRKIRGNLCI